MPNILIAVPSKKEKLPLSVTHPDLAKEADGWDPTTVTFGSGKKLRWKCSRGHQWEAVVGSRTTRNRGCPICSNQKVLAGFNDLATTNPDIAKEAYEWDPSTVTAGSNKKYKFKCKDGHIWETLLPHRTGKKIAGCPICSGRKVLAGFNDLVTTHPEIAKEAYKWDPTTVTFGSENLVEWLCPVGHIWKTIVGNRTAKNIGCLVCSNNQIKVGFNDLTTTHPKLAMQANGWDPETVTAGSNKNYEWKCDLGHIWKISPNHRTRSKPSGCPVCSGRTALSGFNDLKTLRPDIAMQADNWDPGTVTISSGSRQKWKCGLGHRWLSTVANRTVRERGCPICADRVVLEGFNDVATTFPNLAQEAHGWDPKKFVAGNNSKFKWKCELGHEWEAVLVSRSFSGVGCPTCANSGFDPNSDGFLYFLWHLDWRMYQVGITNYPKDRLQKHIGRGWELVELRGPMDGDLARQWETAILRMLKAKGADLSNEKIAGKFDGYSEAWSKSTFEVKSIKELMRLTEEFEG